MTKRVRLWTLPVLFAGLLGCSDDRHSPNEPEPQPALTVSDRTVDEGSTCLFTISLDRAATAIVWFNYTTHDVTATAGDDYTAQSGADTIDVGETSRAILVPTSTDVLSEPSETFELILSSIHGATVTDSVGTGTITNTSDVSFASQVQPLLRTSCAKASCHAASPAGGGLVLGTEADYTVVINATGTNTAQLPASSDGRVVQPGNGSVSTLYTKTTATPPFGSRMPMAAPALTSAQQNLIRDWINQGALNN